MEALIASLESKPATYCGHLIEYDRGSPVRTCALHGAVTVEKCMECEKRRKA